VQREMKAQQEGATRLRSSMLALASILPYRRGTRLKSDSPSPGRFPNTAECRTAGGTGGRLRSPRVTDRCKDWPDTKVRFTRAIYEGAKRTTGSSLA